MSVISFVDAKDRLEQWDVYLIEFDFPTTTLLGDLTVGASAVSGVDISDFPNNGYITTPSGEIIEYHQKTFVPASGASAGFFQVSTRGVFKTTAASAASGDVVKPPFIDTVLWSSTEHPELGSGLPILEVPNGVSQQITPTEGKSTIGTMSFTVVDDDNFFSKLSSLIPLRNTKVTMKAGFKNLPLADFETEWVGLVRELELSNDHNKWEIICKDLKRFLKTDIFTQFGETELSGSLTDSALTINVDSTDASVVPDTAFVDPADFPYSVYVKINDEIIGPITSISTTTLTVQAGGRGSFGTVASAHSIDDSVEQAFLFGPANPITLALEIMLSTGDGTNHATYDTLSSTMGMAIDSSLVDVAEFESQRDEFIAGTNYQFYIDSQQNEGKTWIEKNILRPTNSVIFVLRNGNISYKISTPPIPGSTPVSIGINQVKGKVNFDIGLSNIINQIQMQYNKDPLSGDFKKTLLIIDADSISRHGPSPIREIPLDGVHGATSLMGDLGGDATAISIGKNYRARFSEVAPVLKTKINLTLRENKVGDLVAFTWDKLPDWLPNRQELLTGRNLVDNIMEISSFNPKYDASEIEIKLIGTQYSWRKFAVIGPDSMVDFTLDTDLNKQSYAYFCNDTTKRMSDGSDPSRIWFGGGGSTDSDLEFIDEVTDTIGIEFQINNQAVFDEFHIVTGHDHNNGSNDGAPIDTLPENAIFVSNLIIDNDQEMVVTNLINDHAMLF